MHSRLLTIAGVVALTAMNVGRADAASCDSLASIGLPRTTILAAQAIDAGTFTPPGPTTTPQNPALANLPAFCRVAASLKPTNDSDIRIRVQDAVSLQPGTRLGSYEIVSAIGAGGMARRIRGLR